MGGKKEYMYVYMYIYIHTSIYIYVCDRMGAVCLSKRKVEHTNPNWNLKKKVFERW